jgi:hypothetical protein
LNPERKTAAERPPRVGDRLSVDGNPYDVTDVSHYSNNEGYQVTEWCCEDDSSECYLLEETKEGSPARWFFTRWIRPGKVSFSGGGSLPQWIDPQPVPKPPASLLCDGDIFQHAETTDGMYEEDEGASQRKITWDFWNASRTSNVAIELWGDGGFDHYNGRYIDATRVLYLPPAPSPISNGMFACAGLMFAVSVLFCMVIFELPFDESLMISAAVASVAGFFRIDGLTDAKSEHFAAAALVSALIAAVLGFAFLIFAPLSSPLGIASLALGPMAAASLCRKLSASREETRYLGILTALLPAGGAGFWHYFSYAPGPHTPEQLLLALAPAALGSAGAYLTSAMTFGGGQTEP